jgi:hypothetical protein
MKKRFALLAACALLVAAPPALAETEVFTVTEKDVTETFKDTLPCVGRATITINYNSVFHATELEDGTYHLTGTLTGTFTAKTKSVTYSGHFTQWFGENSNKKSFNGTFTFHVAGSGTDGSKINFQETAHFSVSASGATVEFDKARCA